MKVGFTIQPVQMFAVVAMAAGSLMEHPLPQRYEPFVSHFGAQTVVFVETKTNELLPGIPQAKRKQVAWTILEESMKLRMDPIYLMAIIHNESKFDPHCRGSHGEIGLMQIKPESAKWAARRFKMHYSGPRSLLEPVTNIKLGTAYLGYLKTRFDSRTHLYLPAYNMGIRGLTHALRSDQKPTQYQARVEKAYHHFLSMTADNRF